jgi:hypothetical protein
MRALPDSRSAMNRHMYVIQKSRFIRHILNSNRTGPSKPATGVSPLAETQHAEKFPDIFIQTCTILSAIRAKQTAITGDVWKAPIPSRPSNAVQIDKAVNMILCKRKRNIAMRSGRGLTLCVYRCGIIM